VCGCRPIAFGEDFGQRRHGLVVVAHDEHRCQHIRDDRLTFARELVDLAAQTTDCSVYVPVILGDDGFEEGALVVRCMDQPALNLCFIADCDEPKSFIHWNLAILTLRSDVQPVCFYSVRLTTAYLNVTHF
jgi:hypothetical protein